MRRKLNVSMVPSFPSNVTIVVKSRVKVIDPVTKNATYTYTEMYNGEAWMYSVNSWILDNNVPVARESKTLLVPYVGGDIDESSFITIDAIPYTILDCNMRRNFGGWNHTEIRVERRET